MNTVTIIVFIIYCLVNGVFCYSLAKNKSSHKILCGVSKKIKGYNEGLAFFAGVFFGIVALIYYVGLPDRSDNE